MRAHRRRLTWQRPEAGNAWSAVPPQFVTMLAGFALAAAAFTQKYGIHLTGNNAVHAAFLSAWIAVCIPFLQRLVGDRVSLSRVMLPVSLAVLGTFLLTSWSLPFLGDALLLACAVVYGLQAVLVGKIKSRNALRGVARGRVCVLRSGGRAGHAGVDRTALGAPSTPAEWSGVAALTVLCTFIPWNLFHNAQQFKKLDAYRLGLLYTLEPVVTAAVGLPLKALGVPVSVDALTVSTLAGCVLIVFANERMARE